MRVLTNLLTNRNLPFIAKRSIFYTISILLMVATIVVFLVKGLNYGVDFEGGIMIEARTQNPANISELRKTLNTLDLGEASLQQFGSDRDILIRMETPKGGEGEFSKAVEKIKNAFTEPVEFRRIETVGPRAGQELISNGLQAIIWGLVAILIYVWMRFEWQFGLSAVITLFHNAIAVFGLYVLFGIEFNTTAIVGILTTIGYSINDIVVVFDRIRENLRKYKKKELAEVLNLSINETLSRTILTSSATLSALLGLYFLGGEIIASFSLPIIVGIIVGTYASICLAAPLLLIFKLVPEKEEGQESLVP